MLENATVRARIASPPALAAMYAARLGAAVATPRRRTSARSGPPSAAVPSRERFEDLVND